MPRGEDTHFVINVTGAALPDHAAEAIGEALRATASERLAALDLGPGYRLAAIEGAPVSAPRGRDEAALAGWRIVIGGDFGITIERT